MTYCLNIPTKPMHSIVLSAPHCGTRFSESFIEQSPLSYKSLLETADLGTDVLIDSLPEITAIKANFARSFVDLNRARAQLDRSIVEGLDRAHDIQTMNGYGVIPRFARVGALTHSRKISKQDAEARLQAFYDPYHHALYGCLAETVAQFGQAILIDVHSAPAYILNEIDIQIGTLHGKSCDSALRSAVVEAFQAEGLNVALELPFSGGYITQNYSTFENIQTIQIEINRKHCVDDHNDVILTHGNGFASHWRKALKNIICRLSTHDRR